MGFCRDVFSFPLGKFLIVKLPGSVLSGIQKLDKTLPNYCQQSCTIYIDQQGMSITVAPYPWQHSVFASLFNFSQTNGYVLVSCDFNLHFSDNDVEYLLMYLLVITISSFAKCLFKSMCSNLLLIELSVRGCYMYIYRFICESCHICLYVNIYIYI